MNKQRLTKPWLVAKVNIKCCFSFKPINNPSSLISSMNTALLFTVSIALYAIPNY